MKLLSFAQSLLPRLEKDRIVEDLRVTISELGEVVAPNYSAASDFFKTSKFASDNNKDFSDYFVRKFDYNGISKTPNFVTDINKRLPNVKKNAEYIQEQIEAILEKDVISDGLTARKTILIRGAEHISFISRFASDLLNYVYIHEANEIGTDIDESMQLAPAMRAHIDKNFGVFASLLSHYGVEPKKFVSMFADIPEIVLSSKTQNSIAGLYKEHDIDPFSAAYVAGFTGNPIYHLRLLVAEWQSNRYKANKDKKKMLELRLLHLKLLAEKKNDTKIQSEIEYVQGRVDRIERYLREVESSYEEA